MKRYSIIGLLLFVLTMLLFVGSLILYPYLENQVTDLVSSFGILMIFILSTVFEFIPQYLSPHIFLFSILFVDINPFVALLSVLIGSTLGGALGYAFGMVYQDDVATLFFNEKKIRRLKRLVNRHGKWYVFAAALSPLPFTPMLFGMFHLTRRNFLIYGLIPRIIGLVALFFIVQF